MTAKLSKANYAVSAHCPECEAITSFDPKQTAVVQSHTQHMYQGKPYLRVLYVFSQCSRCTRGALATVLDNGQTATAVLENFFPVSVERAHLPPGVPEAIRSEFREAELCAAFGAKRAASALFRSALEKALKVNGYTKGNDSSLRDLEKRIDAAAADGVITDARRKKAHEDVRSLGNDVLHDEWRQVTDDEVAAARHYTQRMLEDFYDDRATVEGILVAKKRVEPPA
jgi:hypothetical protein